MHRFAGKFYFVRVSWSDESRADYAIEHAGYVESYVDGLVALHYIGDGDSGDHVCTLWADEKQPSFYNDVDIRAAFNNVDYDDDGEFDPLTEYFAFADAPEGDQHWPDTAVRPIEIAKSE